MRGGGYTRGHELRAGAFSGRLFTPRPGVRVHPHYLGLTGPWAGRLARDFSRYNLFCCALGAICWAIFLTQRTQRAQRTQRRFF